MSSCSNATDTASASDPSASIHPSLSSLMISHTFLSLLVPLVISLFYFSTPQSRRRPIFILNLTAIIFAIVVGVLIDAVEIHSILDPLHPWPAFMGIVLGLIGILESMLVDVILLVRIISVYPVSHVGAIRFVLLISIPVLLKLARTINIILFVKFMSNATTGPNAAAAMQAAFSRMPFIKVDWATQMLDNTYASFLFLWRLRSHRSTWAVTSVGEVSFGHRLRTLSRIALSNFVLPAAFSIAQFVCLYRGVNALVLNQLMLANIMLATFGVAFATVWAGNLSRRDARAAASASDLDADPRRHPQQGATATTASDLMVFLPGHTATATSGVGTEQSGRVTFESALSVPTAAKEHAPGTDGCAAV